MKLIELNMAPAQIKRSVQLGWGAAALSAVTTILFTFFFTQAGLLDTPLVIWALSSAAVTGVLGFGVYRRNSKAAIALLVMFLISRAWYYLQVKSIGSPLLVIIFLYCFIEGARGTLAHERMAGKATDASAV